MTEVSARRQNRCYCGWRSGKYNSFALLIGLLGAMALFPISSVAAENDAAFAYLLGDFGGKRTALESHGLVIEPNLESEIVSNISGGKKRGSIGDHLMSIALTLDTEKANLWSAGEFYFEAFGHGGENPSDYVGDYQLTSNIEADETVKIYQAWYEHSFFGGTSSFLAGLHDYNSEFEVLEYAQTLLNGSFGMSIDISQTSPSLYPTTGLALVAEIAPTSGSYLLVGVYDGTPGSTRHPRGTHVDLDADDGVFVGAETGLISSDESDEESYYKFGLGIWYRNGKFEDISGENKYNNQGIYAIAEKLVFREDDSLQGLGVFLQWGISDSQRNQVSNYLGGGLTYTGLLPNRNDDVLSAGVACARNGDRYLDLNPGTERSETALEITYKALLTPWFSLQPDFQYVIQPNMDPTRDNASVLTLRTEVNF